MPFGDSPRQPAFGRGTAPPAARIIAFTALSILLMTCLPARRPAFAGDGLAVAQSQFSAGAYASAVGTLKEITLRHPDDAAAHFLAGRCYYEIHDYDNAIAEALLSVEFSPDNSLYHQWLGRAYGGKADREKSFLLARKVRKELEEAVALDPTNVSARRDLQRFYMDAPWIVGGSRDKALGMVNAIKEIDPVEGRLARADYSLHSLNDIAGADKEYRGVLAMENGRAGPYFEAAEFYAGREDAPALEKALKAAAKAAPSDLRLFYYRGVACVVAGGPPHDAERALREYLAAPQRSDWPSHTDARQWLGRLLESEGRLADAAAEYRKALAEDPSRGGTRARLERLDESLKR
ncbi:MAG: tetratricopeptide repeat protein [Nitrospiraceae bacterium]|nr:tetratricopeptide repeat protein [Nitrospiraceae bacterium]